MKNTSIKHCLGVMALLLFFAACQKDEGNNDLQTQQALQVQKFLALPPDADTCLLKIAAELGRQNEQRNFISRFIENYGYAAWGYTLHAEKGLTVNKYIALVNNNSKTVGAVIQCMLKGDKVRFSLITPYNSKDIIDKLPDMPDKPDELTFRVLFREFGNLIYGHPLTWIVIMDKDGNILREYPATEEQKASLILSKAMNCQWVGIGGGDMYDEHGNYVGGGTDIRWEWRCKWAADETVDWDASPEEGVIWDDPGSPGGGPPPDPQTEEPKNPCELLNKKVGASPNFKMNMSTAISRTKNENLELGVIFTGRSSADYTSRIIRGADGEVQFDLQWKVSGLVHTHNKGQGSVFSYADLAMLVQTENSNRVENIKDFFFGLVTVDGNNAYMLMIEDADAFTSLTGWAVGEPTG